MKRKIVKIDEEKCNGCGQCVPSCAEGAIQVVEGKARLVKDIYCDGLGACLGHCPMDAITIEEREADAFDEAAAMRHVTASSRRADVPAPVQGDAGIQRPVSIIPCGCPGAMARSFERSAPAIPADSALSPDTGAVETPSQLAHWPVQLRLVAPGAPFFQDAELLLAADCAPFAYPDFHRKLLAGRALAIGCPKLDDVEFYVEKLASILKESTIRGITVARMEVPCCGGLMRIARQALALSGKDIPLREVVLGVRGGVAREG